MPDDYPRTQLCLMIEKYGQAIMDEPKRCKGILKDLAPEYRLETNLLLVTLEQKIVEELLKPTGLTPVELQLERLTQSLHDAAGIKDELAYWAVESWALALKVISQPIPRQIVALKPEVLPFPSSSIPPFINTNNNKRNQLLSYSLFFVAWLVSSLLVGGCLVFFIKAKQENKALKPSIINQPMLEAQKNTDKVDETQVYRTPPEQRDAWTENNLGDIYYYGYGVAKNYQIAAQWYRKAAEQGNAVGQCNLGFMYANGYGVVKDYQQAADWYRKAAEQGYADGQNNLGIMYENGYGVAKDMQQAEIWYRKAVEQGHYGAQQKLRKLVAKS